MNIVSIVGSLRKESVHKKLAETLKEFLPENTLYEILTLNEIPMYNQDIDKTNMPASVQMLASKIRGADAVIFCSPEYNYSIPGCLKNAIDWISRIPEHPFRTKPAGIIGASPGALGTARMQYDLRKIGVFLDLNFVNKPEVMINFVQTKLDDKGYLADEKTIEVLRLFLTALIAKIPK